LKEANVSQMTFYQKIRKINWQKESIWREERKNWEEDIL